MLLFFKRGFFAVLILFLCLTTFQSVSVQAATIAANGNQPETSTAFTVAREKSGDYLDPVNTFSDDSPTYIFVSRDASKAGTTLITYQSIAYPVTTLISTGNDLSNLADAGGKILRANVTVFFDAGTYNDPVSTNYFGFSQTNLSLVGLNAGAVTITRSPNGSTMERNGFQHPNIYLENLIFDGGGYNMATSSRGQYFFFLAIGSSGFVMKNCTIQNVGSTNDIFMSNKNVAMNFYRSSGQHNLENVTFKNIKTQGNLGILSFNDAKDSYFKNITITGESSPTTTYSIKIEHTDSTTNPVASIMNVFSGALSLPTDANHSNIYIQDFNYGKIIVPSTFPYAQYKNNNGNTSRSAIQVYQSLPAVTANRGILDLSDNTWLVQAANSRSISNQLTDLLAVNNGMNSASANAKWPKPNIKISPNSSGEIGSFNIPSFTDAVNIVAIPDSNSLFSSTTLVPFSATGTITLTANTKLYNFDFHSKANYTLQEVAAHRGLGYITLNDPNEASTIPGYPVYSTYGYLVSDVAPLFTNASPASFNNCQFTSLVNEIQILPLPSTNLPVGASVQVTAALRPDDTNSYTGMGFNGTVRDTADDKTIQWYSSDPSIATVDLSSGLVTAIGVGTVTIYAKAIDIYNQGEIEKPFVSVQLEIFTPTLEPVLNNMPTSIPFSGFAPDRLSLLPQQSINQLSFINSDLWLEIPSQNIQMNIVGVPLQNSTWDVSWLGRNAGYLEGSAFPTLNGNSVLTGHNYLSSGLPGPFVFLKGLKYGDSVIIHAFGARYLYQVQSIDYLKPGNVKELLEHKETPWLTLLTCDQFDETIGTYRKRIAVRAVLISIKTER